MYFDRPGLILLATLATFGPLVGLALVRLMNYIALNNSKNPDAATSPTDALFSLFTLIAIDFLNGLVISAWLAQMYDEYKKMSGDSPRPIEREERSPEGWHGLRDLNTGKMVNAFTMPRVQIDARRDFAIQQLRKLQYYGDSSKLNWTETYWLKEKPRRWKGKNEDFRVMMHDIDGLVIEKADPKRPNSGYILRDEITLHRMAQGALPH